MQGLIKLYLKSGKVSLNQASLFFYRHSPFIVREQAAYALAVVRKNKLPDNRFVIFAQGRSGSTLLVDLMNSHPEIFTFGEIMQHNVVRNLRNPRRYAEGVCSLSKRPTTGFKVKVHQIEKIQGHDPKAVLTDFHQHGWKLIYLKRSNVLRHAISDVRTEKTGEYHNVKGAEVGGKRATRQRIRMEMPELMKAIRFRETNLEQEARVLEGLPHLLIEYEKDLLGPEAQRESMNRVFAFLGLPPHDAETAFRKVTSRSIEDDIENFDEIRGELTRAGYDRFFSWG